MKYREKEMEKREELFRDVEDRMRRSNIHPICLRETYVR